MTAKMGERDTKEDVSKVFRLFDDDRRATFKGPHRFEQPT